MPTYARVIVDQSGGNAFDYEIPPALEGHIQPGSRVSVPVRNRTARATVIELLDHSDASGIRFLEAVIGPRPVLTPTLLRLARWIADYYCCPIEPAMRVVLPQVIRTGAVRHKVRLFARLLRPLDQGELGRLDARAPKQAVIIRRLAAAGAPVPVAVLTRESGANRQTLAALAKHGAIAIEPEQVNRDPFSEETFLQTKNLELNEEQRLALQVVEESIAAKGAAPPILLHGVTGSGKTEIYLQAIQTVLARGQTAIMLVPEISLTPQTVERFKGRFAGSQDAVAVLHSHLSSGERHDEWHKINEGRARIVIGARSAIFAPLEDLGLIVVDEEHENSYKQEEAPRYHGRDIAVLRANMEKCAILLGSATPSIESYHNASTGKYRLLRLTRRVDERKMPLIRVVDLRQESSKDTARALLSGRLCTAIEARLAKREQSILFLNRRGFSTSLLCQQCGYVAECPNCSVALTYHRAVSRLNCHICGHTAAAPAKCPSCGDPKIRFLGAGTEKVEEAVAKLFPKAVVRRMDADAMTRKDSFREILGAFRSGKIDILVGTQMIAKGLHFPNVTLVGIINADLALHLPDFRAGERTFQLLTQVAGRAGRGEVEGEVLVQSFTPFSPSIQFARHHDFDGFWQQEIEFRQKWDFPPFSHMVLITIRSAHQTKAAFSAETLARRLKEVLPPSAIHSEPTPAPLEKARGEYRFHLMLRSKNIMALSRRLREVLEKLTFPEDVMVSVDIDPYQLL